MRTRTLFASLLLLAPFAASAQPEGRGELVQLQCNCDPQTFVGARPGMSLNVALGFRTFLVRGIGGVGGQVAVTRWSNVSRTVPLGPGAGRAPDTVREGNLWAVTVGITLS